MTCRAVSCAGDRTVDGVKRTRLAYCERFSLGPAPAETRWHCQERDIGGPMAKVLFLDQATAI